MTTRKPKLSACASNICYLLRGRLLVYIAPLFPAGIINCGNDTHADTKQYEKSEKDIDVFHVWICCLFAKKIRYKVEHNSENNTKQKSRDTYFLTGYELTKYQCTSRNVC